MSTRHKTLAKIDELFIEETMVYYWNRTGNSGHFAIKFGSLNGKDTNRYVTGREGWPVPFSDYEICAGDSADPHSCTKYDVNGNIIYVATFKEILNSDDVDSALLLSCNVFLSLILAFLLIIM